MTATSVQISSLRKALFDEIFATLGLVGNSWRLRLLKPLLWTAATRFSRIAANFESYIESSGFHHALRRILPNFVTGFQASGVENAPSQGPLLVVSNHPGTFDSLVIAASLPRDDVSIVSSNFLFLRQLPNTSRHLIFTSRDAFDRMAVARACIRHLNQDGALLIFPSGRLDPDPDFMPGASDELGRWSPSLELFLKKVPQTRVLVTIISGTMKSAFVNSPLLRSWKYRLERQRAAEILQVARQMSLPLRMKLAPRITFGSPFSMQELFRESPAQSALETIIVTARKLLERHRQLWNIETAAS